MTPRSVTAPRHYPSPADAGIRIPPHLLADRFTAGFDHALKGGQLNRVEYFRRSFRLGFRTAKLYLREVRRQRGVPQLPVRHRVRMRADWPER